MFKKKKEINRYSIMISVIVFCYNFPNFAEFKSIETTRINIILSENITSIHKSKGYKDYQFWSKQYINEFVITNGSVSNVNHKRITKLRKGQKLEITISKKDYKNLKSKNEDVYTSGISSKEICVMGIRLNHTSLLSTSEFYYNQQHYTIRLLIFRLFIGTMFFIHGYFDVPKKINYMIIGVFLCIIILFRIFEIVIY